MKCRHGWYLSNKRLPIVGFVKKGREHAMITHITQTNLTRLVEIYKEIRK